MSAPTLQRALDILEFHVGSEEQLTPGGNKVIVLNAEDFRSVLEAVLATERADKYHSDGRAMAIGRAVQALEHSQDFTRFAWGYRGDERIPNERPCSFVHLAQWESVEIGDALTPAAEVPNV